MQVPGPRQKVRNAAVATAPAHSGTHFSGHLTVPEAWAEQGSLSSQYRHKGPHSATSPRPRPHVGRTRREAPAWVGGGPPLLRTVTSAPSTHGPAQVPPRTACARGQGANAEPARSPRHLRAQERREAPTREHGSERAAEGRERAGEGRRPRPPRVARSGPSGCPGEDAQGTLGNTA